MNGRANSRFALPAVETGAQHLASRLPDFRFRVVDGDHFFLLSKQEETLGMINEFLEDQPVAWYRNLFAASAREPSDAHIAAADGSTRWEPSELSPQVLSAVLTIDGGEDLRQEDW